jgi:hypothetical protein
MSQGYHMDLPFSMRSRWGEDDFAQYYAIIARNVKFYVSQK